MTGAEEAAVRLKLESQARRVIDCPKDTGNAIVFDLSTEKRECRADSSRQDNIDSQHSIRDDPNLSSQGCETMNLDGVNQQGVAQLDEPSYGSQVKMQMHLSQANSDEKMITYIHNLAEELSGQATTSVAGVSGSFAEKSIASIISHLKPRLEGKRFLDIGAAYGLMPIIFKVLGKCSSCWGYELPENTSYLHIFENLVNQLFPFNESDVHLSFQNVDDLPALKWEKGIFDHSPHYVYSYWFGFPATTRNGVMAAVSRTLSVTHLIVTNAPCLTMESVLGNLNDSRPQGDIRKWTFDCEIKGEMFRSSNGAKKIWIFCRGEQPIELRSREVMSKALTFETDLRQVCYLNEFRKTRNAKTTTSTLNFEMLGRLLHQNGISVKKVVGAGGYGVVIQAIPTRGRNAGQTIAIKLESRKQASNEKGIEEIFRSSSLMREVKILQQLQEGTKYSEYSYNTRLKSVFQNWPAKIFDNHAQNNVAVPTQNAEFPVCFVQDLVTNNLTTTVIENNVVVAMAMEYSGEAMTNYVHKTLENVIAHAEIIEELRLVCKELLRAVRVLHVEKVIHYDLKPENILMTFDNAGKWTGAIKIVDFGFSESWTCDQMYPEISEGTTRKRKADDSLPTDSKQSKGRGWKVLQQSLACSPKETHSYITRALSESIVYDTFKKIECTDSLPKIRPSHAYGTFGMRCPNDTKKAFQISNSINQLSKHKARQRTHDFEVLKLEQRKLGEAGDMYAIGVIFLRFISSCHVLDRKDKELENILALQSVWMEENLGIGQQAEVESIFNSPLAKWIESKNCTYQRQKMRSGQHGEEEFSFKKFRQRGPISEFLKFISGLLNTNADKRLTSFDALCHDFVKFSILPQVVYDHIYSNDGFLVEGQRFEFNGDIYTTQNIRIKHVPGMGVGIFSDEEIIAKGTLLTFYGGEPRSPEFPNSFTFNIAVKHEGIDGEVTHKWPIERYIKNHCLGALINSSYNSDKDSESRRDLSVNNVVVFGDFTASALIKVGNDDVRFQVLATRDIPPGTQLRYYYDINLTGNGKYAQMEW